MGCGGGGLEGWEKSRVDTPGVGGCRYGREVLTIRGIISSLQARRKPRSMGV